MKQRTYQAAGKRLRITKGKKGGKSKILHIAAGRDHFNAREAGKTTRGKRRQTSLANTHRKSVQTMIPGITA